MDNSQVISDISKNIFGLDALKTGGQMTPQQASKFIKMMQDEPTIMNDARLVPMKSDNMVIDKLGFGSRILRAATEGQELPEDQKTVPDTDKVELSAKEVIAEIFISDSSIENNIEGGNIVDTVMGLLAKRAAIDLEELIVNGDTTSSDPYLKMIDGLRKKATSYIVDATGETQLTKDLFKKAYKAVPSKYRTRVTDHAFYLSHNNVIEWVDSAVSRQTNMGDRALDRGTLPNAYGIPVKGCANLSPYMVGDVGAETEVSDGIFTHPKNMVVGITRDIRVESARNIKKRGFDIVLTAKVDAVYEEEKAVAKIVNIPEV